MIILLGYCHKCGVKGHKGTECTFKGECSYCCRQGHIASCCRIKQYGNPRILYSPIPEDTNPAEDIKKEIPQRIISKCDGKKATMCLYLDEKEDPLVNVNEEERFVSTCQALPDFLDILVIEVSLVNTTKWSLASVPLDISNLIHLKHLKINDCIFDVTFPPNLVQLEYLGEHIVFNDKLNELKALEIQYKNVGHENVGQNVISHWLSLCPNLRELTLVSDLYANSLEMDSEFQAHSQLQKVRLSYLDVVCDISDHILWQRS